MRRAPLAANENPGERITRYIAELGGWRSARLAELRGIVTAASSELQEEWKWGVPVWSSNGNVIAAAAFADHVKLNFFKGATLEDPAGLFNAGLEAKATRAIDFREADPVPAEALVALVRAAVAHAKPKVPRR
jgi:hypothetical protein